MRIVIDLQACQTPGSKNRGIGRYSMALAKAMARSSRGHEIWLALNGRFLDTIETVRSEFDDLIPQDHIRVFDVAGAVADAQSGNHARRNVSERMREAFLEDLRPDVVHTSSHFEGLSDDAVTSIGLFEQRAIHAITLYDLIPLLNPVPYLENPVVRDWYYRKLQSAKRADLLLAISESSRREGLDGLSLPAERVVNISSAIDPIFRPIEIRDEYEALVRRRYGLKNRFVMYTGGIDHRKNIEGLIAAYAALPKSVRSQHQLAIVCSIRDEDRQRLGHLASSCGLLAEEIVFTGYVSETDLLTLYNLCTLFVFPSLHEGFGLPALEAMACGAPTIGANNSSIPEVIGRSDALFDARSQESITQKISEVLRSERRLQDLREHGLKQSAQFSWDASADHALSAMEVAFDKRRSEATVSIAQAGIRPRLAFISPLPPEKTGIADYSAELLPELSRFYQIDVIVNHPHVDTPWVRSNFPIRDLDWFETHADEYDRILYQFGNSDFHTHMFDLLVRHPGTVVLHDFFLSGVQYWREHHHGVRQNFSRSLLLDHGYRALLDHLEGDWDTAIWRFPTNRAVFEHAAGVIVHSRYSADMAKLHYGEEIENELRVTPLLRVPPAFDRDAAREALGLNSGDYVIGSFGLLSRTKLNERLLDAFLASRLVDDPKCQLIFVGENDGGEYGKNLIKKIKSHGLENRIKITGFASAELYKNYLAAVDSAVQLRSLSRGETSAAVLDCLGHGIATIVNAHGTMAELPESVVCKLRDDFDDCELVAAMENFHANSTARLEVGKRAIAYMRDHNAPEKVGRDYHSAIEFFSERAVRLRRKRLIHSIQTSTLQPLPPHEMAAVARHVVSNSKQPRRAQLLVNITELRQHGAHSGVQRVVRSVLHELLHRPPEGLRVEPVYIDTDGEWAGFRYARQYTLGMIGHADASVIDEIVEPQPGDILLELDLNQGPALRLIQSGFYDRWRARGVKIHFVVYDLLPVLHPEYFVPGAFEGFNDWIAAISSVADGLMCISKSVADEVFAWLQTISVNRQRELGIGWFHLGADTKHLISTRGMPPKSEELLERFALRPTFLMVGTLEPRKGHNQVLDAMEILWRTGGEASLVIVGNPGWMVDDLLARIKAHPELDKRLFWISGASDEYLTKIYENASALLAASFGEGFGLPLVEAAQRKLPIIARDIPVFREVAGSHARYFSGGAPALARALREWLDAHITGNVPRSEAMSWQTWSDATTELIGNSLEGRWQYVWLPDGSRHFRGSHHFLHTQCGTKLRGQVSTKGEEGFLFYGPYIPLSAGAYELQIFGKVTAGRVGNARLEVAVNRGGRLLAVEPLQEVGHPADDASSRIAALKFMLEYACDDLEVRLWVSDKSEITVSRIAVSDLNEEHAVSEAAAI
ncbi:glycosyltransferase [Paraburkholderia aspalathi]|uniref:glycosyltransferase n=1 Tax=Paraburkholderia nemoris TaxID=2793076 RepID=UPI00190A2E5B|nr:glycosyltransferase [Paraburkholderia nemoris]MBK3741077.1 glycosyltransferase [Paraburkholderia aspalathi]